MPCCVHANCTEHTDTLKTAQNLKNMQPDSESGYKTCSDLAACGVKQKQIFWLDIIFRIFRKNKHFPLCLSLSFTAFTRSLCSLGMFFSVYLTDRWCRLSPSSGPAGYFESLELFFSLFFFWSFFVPFKKISVYLQSRPCSRLSFTTTRSRPRRDSSCIQVCSSDTSADEMGSWWNEERVLLSLFISHVFYKASQTFSSRSLVIFQPWTHFWAWIIQTSEALAVTLCSRRAEVALSSLDERPSETELGKDFAGCRQTV